MLKIDTLIKSATIAIGLLFIVTPLAAQEPTDAEIGYNREEVYDCLVGGQQFINKKFVDRQADVVRSAMVENYIAYQEFSAQNEFVSIPVSGCDNMSFDNNTDGWAMYYSNGTYNGTNLLSDNTTLNTFSALGSSTLPGFNGRIEVVSPNTNDLVLGIVDGTPRSPDDKIIRIGVPRERFIGREEIAKKFILTPENSVLKYSYAVVLNDSGHGPTINPYFKVTISIINDNGNVILPPCASIRYDAVTAKSAGFETRTGIDDQNEYDGDYRYKTWNTNIIDLSQYVDLNTHPVVTLSFSVSDCYANLNAHEAWAYVEAACMPSAGTITTTNGASDFCIGGSAVFQAADAETFTGDNLTWNFYEGDNPVPIASQSTVATENSNSTAMFSFPYPGVYRVEYNIARTMGANPCEFQYNRTIVVRDCSECVDCTSFNPVPGKKYIISAWVTEKTTSGDNVQVKSYTSPYIKLSYNDVGQITIGTDTFRPSGDIIDGWQRITGEFILPADIDDLQIDLDNGNSLNVSYFDDIRVIPFNGSMKSFVYDQETQRLMGELDENNFATFYEYDSEGGLVRVKKETSNGVKTIKETRSGNVKRQP
jgi:hypothetical protein